MSFSAICVLVPSQFRPIDILRLLPSALDEIGREDCIESLWRVREGEQKSGSNLQMKEGVNEGQQGWLVDTTEEETRCQATARSGARGS